MSTQKPFTIEQLWKSIGEGTLVGAKCRKCGKIHFPPRQLCDTCLSNELEWNHIPTEGTLQTYTIIYIAPAQFQAMAPYAIGIVGLANGLKIPGMIRNAPLDQIKIGMRLSIAFEPSDGTSQWPQWPRYYFKPA